ncbi:hypothetical protein [Acetobacterium fimetarium]|nr:hypothetical protein [Acetobacterium fimetarium]
MKEDAQFAFLAGCNMAVFDYPGYGRSTGKSGKRRGALPGGAVD